ncbi:hypothetical protein Pan216_42270 [Planctomycetes bacterium Pan216]|uniref:Uncharacterized protein n=1 Tax=Kolteria novifilia TaxID=2527975 RepID=A0A518B8P1_9BACT|nr:hypothetical protein Pan216_42270 [Planctomycetes bacterium Pan216]
MWIHHDFRLCGDQQLPMWFCVEHCSLTLSNAFLLCKWQRLPPPNGNASPSERQRLPLRTATAPSPNGNAFPLRTATPFSDEAQGRASRTLGTEARRINPAGVV